ncbi:SLOG family protein [Pseudobutyrivibrio sp. MD2005]|uniref:SLOG family protein n=1 Tax=Pseudobutyrivibrio sp. MD2005 TaxID=1410616 RepID=UPI000485D136|nr:SLOG family protein [Pseudobutyrivibrio sp. MD2005]
MLKIDIERAVSFTGHRPERLDMPEDKVQEWLEYQIRKAVADGYTDFISGMQRGVDLWAAEIVLKVRSEMKNKGIRLFSAVAFRGMENRWEKEWHKRYHAVLKAANGVTFVCDRPGRSAFFKRNEWMVDHSKRLIAVYTGAPGGTKETIQYAKQHRKDIVLIR